MAWYGVVRCGMVWCVVCCVLCAVRAGDDWEELAALLQRKMAAAFENAAKLVPVPVPLSEGDNETGMSF